MVHKRVLLPPVPGAATVVVLDDGRVGFGTWGADRKRGRASSAIADDEHRLVPAEPRPAHRPRPGQPDGPQPLGLHAAGQGRADRAHGPVRHDERAPALRVGRRRERDRARQGDEDGRVRLRDAPRHEPVPHGLSLHAPSTTSPAKKYKSQLLTSAMSIPIDRYIQYAPKDFFYVHGPRPDAAHAGEGRTVAAAWEPDDGRQPPPQLDARALDGAACDGPDGERRAPRRRARARDVAGARGRQGRRRPPRRSASSPATRRGACSCRSGSGSPTSKRPLGLATDGRLAVPVRGRSGVGGPGRRLRRAARRWPGRTPHRRSVPTTTSSSSRSRSGKARWRRCRPRRVRPRSARPSARRPSGRWIVARGVTSSAAPLARALAKRGVHAGGRPRPRRARNRLPRPCRDVEPAARPLRRVGPLRGRQPAAVPTASASTRRPRSSRPPARAGPERPSAARHLTRPEAGTLSLVWGFLGWTQPGGRRGGGRHRSDAAGLVVGMVPPRPRRGHPPPGALPDRDGHRRRNRPSRASVACAERPGSPRSTKSAPGTGSAP